MTIMATAMAAACRWATTARAITIPITAMAMGVMAGLLIMAGTTISTTRAPASIFTTAGAAATAGTTTIAATGRAAGATGAETGQRAGTGSVVIAGLSGAPSQTGRHPV